MRKLFNIAGPCNPQDHYIIDATRRLGSEAEKLIEQKQYFVIHAARQSGKTTLLWELTDKIKAEGKYYALYCSLEKIQGITDPKEAMPEIIDALKIAFYSSNIPKSELFAKEPSGIGFASLLQFELSKIIKILDKPLIIFFDEADCLSEGTLISFLRQLRDGYVSRSRIPFVHTVALVGMRNIRDFKARIRPESETLGSSSPFNIVSESMTLRNFKYEEVTELYSQHTELTGQAFKHDAEEFIFEQTQGQPWLVNAVARECVEKICNQDYSIAITREMARVAINNLILQRGTHFDSLMERLKEERVKRVIEPLLLGRDDSEINRTSDDFLYTRDLGLIRQEEKTRRVIPANQIYAETMARALNLNTQESLMKYEKYEIPNYMKGGKMDVKILLSDFQIFWRENSEIWERVYEYREAAPHLILMAFLQRVINGGGLLQREFALGNQRVDLCIVYKDGKYPIELKIDRGEGYLKKGFSQLLEYMDKCGVSEGSIIIFDKNPGKSWDERIFAMEELHDGKRVMVFGC